MKKTNLILSGAMMLALANMPAQAHHSFAATYKEDAQPEEIRGTVKSFQLRNPHTYVLVEDESQKDQDGTPIRWTIEWGAPLQLSAQGVDRNTLKVGDKVIVTGSPSRTPEDYRLRLRSVTRPSDGWKWPVGNQTFN